MSRKEMTVTIQLDNRDKGKSFFITEMPSRQAEQWADRAFLALAHSGLNLPAGIERGGMPEIAQVAHLLGGVQFPELAPLMDELLYSCVKIIEPDLPAVNGVPFVRPLQDRGDVSDDIQDVGTRQYLRREALGLHVNFSLAAVLLNLLAAASELRNLSTLPTTRMSRRRSVRSSAVT